MTDTGDSGIMADNGVSTFLVVHPSSMLWALEEVERGRTAQDVMFEVIDIAHENKEDED